MPNLVTHPAEAPVRLCLHADDGGEAGFCFRPADEGDAGISFHADDQPGNGAGCFHPVDSGSVSPCFRPDDDQPAATTTDPGRPVSPCFHPGDVSLQDGGNVNSCFHPEEPPVNSCRHAGDDLVAGLHRTLTGAEEQHLAALAVRP